MSGTDEQPVTVEDGKVRLPSHMVGKISVVRGRFSDTTKCGHPDCDEDDAYSVCIGPETRLSTLHTMCCREHLRWGTERVYEAYNNLKPAQKKYYTRQQQNG